MGRLCADKGPRHLVGKLIADFPAVQRNGWKLWPAAAMFNYRFVPLPLRVLFLNCVALVWCVPYCLVVPDNTDAASHLAWPALRVPACVQDDVLELLEHALLEEPVGCSKATLKGLSSACFRSNWSPFVVSLAFKSAPHTAKSSPEPTGAGAVPKLERSRVLTSTVPEKQSWPGPRAQLARPPLRAGTCWWPWVVLACSKLLR